MCNPANRVREDPTCCEREPGGVELQRVRRRGWGDWLNQRRRLGVQRGSDSANRSCEAQGEAAEQLEVGKSWRRGGGDDPASDLGRWNAARRADETLIRSADPARRTLPALPPFACCSSLSHRAQVNQSSECTFASARARVRGWAVRGCGRTEQTPSPLGANCFWRLVPPPCSTWSQVASVPSRLSCVARSPALPRPSPPHPLAGSCSGSTRVRSARLALLDNRPRQSPAPPHRRRA